MQQATLLISKENEGLAIGRISWLNQLGKKYSSMVIYLKEKAQKDKILVRDFIEVEGKSAITQI